MLRILRQHPRLSSWQWLSLAESDSAFVVMAAGFIQRRLLVVDKENLTIQQASRGQRLSRKWQEIDLVAGSNWW